MKYLKMEKKYIFLLVIMAIYIIYRFYLIHIRYYDHDEFQHLNATWNLANGKIPFKDFFEHHFPWLYHSSTYVFTIFSNVETNANDAIRSIYLTRIHMQFYFLLSMFFFYKAIRVMHNKLTGFLFLVLYTSSIPLILKTIEFRCDVPALMFFAASSYTLLSAFAKKELKYFLWACFLFNCTIMCTQKYIMMLPIFSLMALYFLIKLKGSKFQKLKYLSLSILFFLLPFGLTALYYLAHNSLDEFIYNNLTLNFNWKNKGAHWYHTDYFMWLSKFQMNLSYLSIIGGIILIIKNKKKANTTQVLMGLYYIWFIASLYLIPISALQFYIIVVPSICFFAGLTLNYIHEKLNFIPIALILISLVYNDYRTRVFYGSHRVIQDNMITYLTENTSKSEAIFVGNPNYAIYRPSHNYYHFIHWGVWLILTDEEKDEFRSLFKSIETMPRIISYDYNIKSMFKELVPLIEKHYETIPGMITNPGHMYEQRLLIRKEPSSQNVK